MYLKLQKKRIYFSYRQDWLIIIMLKKSPKAIK